MDSIFSICFFTCGSCFVWNIQCFFLPSTKTSCSTGLFFKLKQNLGRVRHIFDQIELKYDATVICHHLSILRHKPRYSSSSTQEGRPFRIRQERDVEVNPFMNRSSSYHRRSYVRIRKIYNIC
mmetsp:Transcript_26178/g.29918  ORF Transcript_26178/g.29918 Transcript_26178/m.29918 type:complete len:123 (-) Transcript_26178:27-395(-)